jgi:hypothetical protein
MFMKLSDSYTSQNCIYLVLRKTSSISKLLSCLCGAPSLTRGRVCNLKCNHSMVRVAQNPKPYFTGPGSRIYIPQEQGGPVIPPGTGFPLRRLKFEVTYDGQSVSQSVSQYVLVSSSLEGLATRYCFLSVCYCLKFAVLFL